MQLFELRDLDSLALRSHPWSGSPSDPTLQHHNLVQSPKLIRTSLEDWRPWEHYPATESFYRLLEWLNGPGSVLETSDCAFNGPTPHELPDFDKALQCSGRLMLLFRDLSKNTDATKVHVLTQSLARALSQIDTDFAWGAIGLTIVPVQFTTLPSPPEEQQGAQVMLSLWTWGDDEAEAMTHMDRTISNLDTALRQVGS